MLFIWYYRVAFPNRFGTFPALGVQEHRGRVYMPAKGLPAFIEDVPEYTVRDGRMHISVGGDFEIVMPINVFLQGCALGTRAVKEWHRGRKSEVIAFPQPDVVGKLGAS